MGEMCRWEVKEDACNKWRTSCGMDYHIDERVSPEDDIMFCPTCRRTIACDENNVVLKS